MPPRKSRKGNRGATASKPPPAAADTTEPPVQSPMPLEEETPKEPPLVLTSDKRRGVYECDYCHSDISQFPRIRCAVCPDFDLCLDCFASADHAAAIRSLKAVQDATNRKAPDHNDTHGYRVADSTRYVLFPPSLAVLPSRPSSCVDGDEIESDRPKSDAENLKEPTGETAEKTSMGEKDAVGPKDVVMEDVSKETEAVPKEFETTNSENAQKPTAATDTEQEQDISERDSEKGSESVLVIQEDRKRSWTVEEDLRLLDAIKSCGLGNWVDIAEHVSGQASTNKNAKRCMERYMDEFLGRYGEILPPYTVVDSDDEIVGDVDKDEEDTGDDTLNANGSKRRRLERGFSRSYSAISIMSQTGSSKKKRVVPTLSVPGAQESWPNPYVPPIPNVRYGQEVGRVARARAEQIFFKEITQAATKEAADAIRAEWEASRLNKEDGPTVLPVRAEDIETMKGAELAGYMPRRGDFDMEWDNEAENVLADMEFTSSDSPQDRQLKVQIMQMYNSKLDERERRRQFILSRNLVDYRKNQKADEKLPHDERDLVRRMRLFERLHTPEEHKQFIADILKAKRLRKEIAKLQMYRRMGITSLAEAEKFELDKSRREFHRLAYMQKEAEANAKAEAAAAAASSGEGVSFAGVTESSSYWKDYRTTSTRGRKSISRTPENRSSSQVPHESAAELKDQTAVASSPSAEKTKESSLVESPGYELLSPKEVQLCEKISLLPAQYLQVKSNIIQQSLQQGLLDKASIKRTIVKIDVEKRGKVIDFMAKAGWIASRSGGDQKPGTEPTTSGR